MELLKNILSYIYIIRPKNLFIVGITQYLIYHYLFAKFDEAVLLSNSLLFLFILDTILITAGGYVINDIIDYQSDVINKPHKTFVPETIPVRTARYYYYVILVTGLLLSIYIGIMTDNLPLITLYPLACIILFFYSSKYKNSILTGNIIVSLFVAFVPGIILVAERELIFFNASEGWHFIIFQILLFFIAFSFLINLIREVIKDIEDMEGDKKMGYVTFPIKYGSAKTKTFAMVLCILAIVLLNCWIYLTAMVIDFRIKMYFLLLVVAPLIIIIQILTKTTQKRDFSKISTILKWIMVAGLGGLILLSNSL